MPASYPVDHKGRYIRIPTPLKRESKPQKNSMTGKCLNFLKKIFKKKTILIDIKKTFIS